MSGNCPAQAHWVDVQTIESVLDGVTAIAEIMENCAALLSRVQLGDLSTTDIIVRHHIEAAQHVIERLSSISTQSFEEFEVRLRVISLAQDFMTQHSRP